MIGTVTANDPHIVAAMQWLSDYGHEYDVRPVAASRVVKTYRCPGCDHEIRSGTSHLVVWPTDSPHGRIDDRRHWHTACWDNRATRGPTRRWS